MWSTVKKLTTNMQYGKNGNKYGGHNFSVGIEVLNYLVNPFFFFKNIKIYCIFLLIFVVKPFVFGEKWVCSNNNLLYKVRKYISYLPQSPYCLYKNKLTFPYGNSVYCIRDCVFVVRAAWIQSEWSFPKAAYFTRQTLQLLWAVMYWLHSA